VTWSQQLTFQRTLTEKTGDESESDHPENFGDAEGLMLKQVIDQGAWWSGIMIEIERV
jgi:hypothetical protein